MKFNDGIQWVGTGCFLTMYTLMSFDVYPWNIVAGFMGGFCYLIWSIRVANKPQLVTNIVALTICAFGLFKAFG
jgi:uncharacterized membrane protein